MSDFISRQAVMNYLREQQAGIFYHVTRAGMDFIERVTGIKIIEED